MGPTIPLTELSSAKEGCTKMVSAFPEQGVGHQID
ncbi:unnamed protein product [Cuscuta europaea]|uniref:Uncharacterized protein n=1 Tax=Cuscuta europaea TaxID=41803 RepID=A0A9P0ZJ20_CUSEU|nr:unnamed protein product [Cuscuta europaea]